MGLRRAPAEGEGLGGVPVAGGFGRYMLRAEVAASLGVLADNFDVSEIVEEIVGKHGFVDVGEIDAVEYWVIVGKYEKPKMTHSDG